MMFVILCWDYSCVGGTLTHVISAVHHMTCLTTGHVYCDMRVDIKQVNKTAAYIQVSIPTHF